MLITNHVLSGALVGLLVPRPATAVGMGFVSHFVLDVIPHFGLTREDLMRVAVPDGLVGLAAIGIIAAATPRPIRTRVLAGILGACLPDLDKPGMQFFGRSPYPLRFDVFHGRIQRESARRFPVEVAAATILSVAFASRLRRG